MVAGTKPGVSSAHRRASAVLGVLLACGPSVGAGDGDSSGGSTAHADGTCQLLCAVSAGCQAMDCAAVCDAADPAEVLEVLQALVDRSLACADCALCDELDNAFCSTLAGC